MLTITDVADQLEMSTRTLQDWCKRGIVPGARKVGPVWVLPDTEEVLRQIRNRIEIKEK